ncbi:MAG: succinate dehydrogenase, cytochrome b556 subunit [Alphaproteobacteria bacterium]|nr:succinate dehydrogenase, cytochrome b556 subunit [Alphaproteobacteria bacterium]
MSASRPKPLSPHLQIFRWPLSMALSIGHRITGAGLAAGLLLLTWWLVALATGPEAFAVVDAVVDSWLGGLVLFGFTVAAFLHLGNGIRHLVWDFGYGFDLETTKRSGQAVIAFTVVATALTWLAILAV